MVATSITDCDGDGVTNADEINGPDGIPGTADDTDPNNPCDYNASQITLVATSITDCDGDGVTNADEINGPDGAVGGGDGTDPTDPCDFNASQITVVATSSTDCDGDGVTNADEINGPDGIPGTADDTDPNNPCDYNASQITLVATSITDCDGDGVTNADEINGQDGIPGTADDTDPNNPCDYNASQITLVATSITDCDGDGVTNADEINGPDGIPGTADDTDPTNPCDYNAAQITLLATSLGDCDGDGVTNANEINGPDGALGGGDDTDPLDPCVYNSGQITLAVTAVTDCDGDGVTNADEINGPDGIPGTADDTDPNNPCDYNASQITLVATSITDCDGDGVTNADEINGPDGIQGTADDTDPNNPCDYNASQITLVATSITDCDGDGVTNADEINGPDGIPGTADDTDPTNPCDYNAAQITLLATSLGDCDGDGVTNADEINGPDGALGGGDDTDPLDPCVYNSGQITLAVTAVTDCDGDGVTNADEVNGPDGIPGTADDTDPTNPCDYNASQITLVATSITDCDGDGVTNADEINGPDGVPGTADDTDAQDICSYNASQVSLTPSSTWNTTDCDKDGNPNISDNNPQDPTALDDSGSTYPGDTLVVDILSNDDYFSNNDVSNLGTTAITNLGTGSAGGTVTFDPNTGTLSYVALVGEMLSTVTVDYEVCNTAVSPEVCDTATVYIIVGGATDLALSKVVDSAVPVQLGDDVSFTLTVTNQGGTIPNKVAVVDYIPPGFILSPNDNNGWVSIGGNMVVDTIYGPISSGSSISTFILLRENGMTSWQDLENSAEIIYVEDKDGKDIGIRDIDSNPDSNGSNDVDGSGNVIEDDFAKAAPVVTDLALIKYIQNINPVLRGDTVDFTIDVYNQSNVPVRNIELVDYVSQGISFTAFKSDQTTGKENNAKSMSIATAPGYYFSGSINPGWTFDANSNVRITISGILVPGDSVSLHLLLIVADDADLNNLAAIAEIVSFQDENGNPAQDIDSSPDDNIDNDIIVDNELNNSNQDEDDHDPAVPPVFDLSLTKSIASDISNVQIGDQITYSIEITNEGNIDATNIEVGDFPLSGLEFVPSANPDWKVVDDHLEYTGLLDVAVAESKEIFIIMKITAPVVLNQAEIISARDQAGASMNSKDIDSTPDSDTDNDGEGLPGSGSPEDGGISFAEDDVDPAFFIVCAPIACKAPLNLSMDGSCEPKVTPEMILKSVDFPITDYVISYMDLDGSPLAEPEFNKPMKVSIMVNGCPESICWTDVLIEDKIAPSLECRNDTIFCYELPTYIPPMVYEGCGEFELKILNQTEERICEDSIIKKLTRTFIAVDDQGNESEQCTQELYIKIFDIDDVTFPSDVILSCEDPLVHGKDILGEEEFGVPMLGTIDLRSIVGDSCKSLLEYKDVLITDQPCTRLVMRTWTVYQWLCHEEKIREYPQLIKIIDTTVPQISIGVDTVKAFATRADCTAEINFPSLSVTDNCDDEVDVTLSGGFGVVDHSAGEKLVLPSGVHAIFVQGIDECHNVARDTIYVNVSDEAPPTVLCLENTVVSMNGLSEIFVHANVFDAGSYDACGGKVELTAVRVGTFCNSADTLYSKEVKFCCEDVGSQVMVMLRATDKIGRSNECMIMVNVQDKVIPQLTCPPDITVTCALTIPNFGIFGNVVFEGNQQALSVNPSYVQSATGPLVDGVAFGNCLDTVRVVNTENLNECGLGSITREFTVVAISGLESTCLQVISIVDDGSTKPENIDYPDDMVMYGCPDNTNMIDSGTPEAFESRCDLIGYGFIDNVAVLNGQGGCYNIVRTWKAFNNCSVNKELIGQHDQVITILDTIAPAFESCADTIRRFTLFSPCIDGQLELTKAASDNCTAPNDIIWELNVDINNDGNFDHKIIPKDTIINSVSVASATVPVELQANRVQWVISDQCGNKTVCEEILVVDGAATPAAICLASITSDLVDDGDGESVVIWADEYDIGSSTVGCENIIDLVYSFDSASVMASQTFTCDDIGAQNFRIYLLAIDMATNAVLDRNSCNVELIISDNDGSCGALPIGLSINGNIENYKGGMLANAQVVLVDDASGNSQAQLSDIEGEYLFEDVFKGRDYNVYPVKNDDWLNGISTLDLILIQNHILGREKLDDGFELIAADINNDKVISAIDLVLLRKLILGIDLEVKSNKSWRFTWKGQNVRAMGLDDYIQEDYDVISLSEAININWNGVKVGDISGNASVNNLVTAETRSHDGVEMSYKVKNVNGYSIVSFYLPKMEYDGMQLELQLPKHKYIKEFALRQLKINGRNILIDKEKSIIRLSHALDKTMTISPEKPVFALVLKGDSGSDIEITMSEEWMMPEIYNNRAAKRLNLAVKQTNEISLELFQNEPNPWAESTIIDFMVPQNGEVSIRVMDMNGMIIWSRNETYKAGKHSIELSKRDVRFQGVLIYEIRHANQLIRKKMIHMN